MAEKSDGELAAAKHAWQVAGAPLPIESTDDEVPILQWPRGQESYMDRARFGPIRYDVPQLTDEPDAVGDKAQENYLSTRLTRSRFFLDMRDNWGQDCFMAAVLRRHFGYHGERVATHIAYEMPFMSVLQHRASVAYFAARFCVEPNNELPELVFSVWDNGQSYESAAKLHRLWTKDRYRDLVDTDWRPEMTTKALPGQAANVSPAYSIARTAANTFDGMCTVISGENRLDISDGSTEIDYRYRIRSSTVAPIAGNLMIARMPLLLPGTTRDYHGNIVPVRSRNAS